MLKKKKLLLITTVCIFLFIGLNTFALLSEWPTLIKRGKTLNDTSKLHDFVLYLFEGAVFLGGLASFISLVVSGIQYLMSSGDPAKVTLAKERIQSTLLGLALLLGSVTILKTINPALLELKNISMDDFLEGSDCGKYVEKAKDKKTPTNEASFTDKTRNEYCEETFGEGFTCENNQCTTNFKTMIKNQQTPCESLYVAYYNSSGVWSGLSLKVNEKQSITMTEDDEKQEITFYITSPKETRPENGKPSGCNAILVVCKKANCKGDNEEIHIFKGGEYHEGPSHGGNVYYIETESPKAFKYKKYK